MRMHKKSHLEERLENCLDVLTMADLTNKNMKTSVNDKAYLDLQAIFGNTNPVHVEIGCGKGRFVLEMAKRHPEINFIALERVSNVIICGCEELKELKLNNVHFICCTAEVLLKYFKEHSVGRIYLNFSNPLPKLGYIKQRLTHPKFLAIYKELLIDGGTIWQKTDNEDFFNFSLESYREVGFKILSECRDLKSNPFDGNVITEHEERFMRQGLPIFRAEVQV